MSANYYMDCWNWINAQPSVVLITYLGFLDQDCKPTEAFVHPWGRTELVHDVCEHLRHAIESPIRRKRES